jgi:hypothetical protein
MTEPDPRVDALTWERLAVASADSVFLDDRPQAAKNPPPSPRVRHDRLPGLRSAHVGVKEHRLASTT